MGKIRVAVLRGGPSSEYEVSLKTGATVLQHIPQEVYDAHDIFISREGEWYRNGVQFTPHEALSHFDVIFNALHGQYGEDGKVQHILEMSGIPFTGSGSFASSVAMNKAMTKEVFKKEKIRTPQHKLISNISAENLAELFLTFSPPVVVKPVSAGSSMGVTMVKSFDSFETAIKEAMKHSDTVMVEEYIPGVEATVGVVDGYRDQNIYVLPPIEIRPRGSAFFDYENKYGSGESGAEEIVPGNFSEKDKRELEELARKVHSILGLRHYSRTDFIVSPKRGIFVLETNTLPGLTETSLLPKALHSVGASLSHFLDHVLQLALKKSK